MMIVMVMEMEIIMMVNGNGSNFDLVDFLSYIFSVSENTKIIHLIMMIWLFSFIISNYKLASGPPNKKKLI